MSNHPFEHRRLFCHNMKTKEPRFKIRVNTFPGICFGILFPMDYYTDISISILFINIDLKWRRR